MKLISLDELPETGVSHNPEIRKRTMLARGDVPHLTNFARSVLLPGQVASAHSHAGMHEVFFVASGDGLIHIDGAPHRLAPGTCVAVEPGERHEITNDGPAPLVLLYFGIE